MKLLISLLPLVGGVLGSLRRSKYGCEGTEISLECEEGSYISPVRANYGRFDAGVCNPGLNKVWSTRCIQPTTLRQVNSLCQGLRTCSIDVTSSVFGDPCPDTYKYLEIHYTCQTKVSKPRSENNLPPWLLKMSATTRKPTPGPTTTTTTPSPPTTETREEKEEEEKIEMEPENLFYQILEDEEDYEDEMTLDDLLEQSRSEIFINLPLEEPEVETIKIGEEETVLIATLVSLLSCSLILLISALLYTKMKQRKKKDSMQREIMVSSLDHSKFQDYNTNHNSGLFSMYNDYSGSSGSSTTSSVYTCIPNTQGSIYTTLPNGDRAIVIPLHSNPSYLNQILSSTQRLEPQTWMGQHSTLLYPGANPSNPSAPGPNPENIYIDIDRERY